MSTPRRSSLRTSALFCAGALSLHELRYLIGWGTGSEHGPAGPGHAYLTYLMPLAVGLAAAGLAQVVVRLGRARTRPAAPGRRWPVAWLGASAVLMAIFLAQETAEGLLGPGPTVGVFSHGGLVAVPLALALGALIAMAERGARAVLATRSRLGPAPAALACVRPGPVRAWSGHRAGPRAGELALHLAGRAPPLSSR
ncbi:MAG: hypothetical protein QOF77_2281 [Solirubrobacteraceae bacterium]|jgi:hypothetical protein|nr:hypothetical protein [Solirubrobacteraceae bacterium]